MLDIIFTPRVLAVLGTIGLALFAFSFVWAFFKVSFQKALGRPVPRNWLTNGCDVLAEVGANLPGALNRALKLAGKPGLFLPTQPSDGAPPTSSAATIDALSTENASLRTALADYQRRVAGSHAVTEPTPFDPQARQTIAPEVAAQINRDLPPPLDGQRGSIDIATLLAIGSGVMALLCVVTAIALSAQGCIPVRRFVLDHTAGVPARGDRTPRTMACVTTDAGLQLPVYVSDERRPWPALPRRPDGTQRTCAAGEGCVVETDGGIAHCTAADGGAR